MAGGRKRLLKLFSTAVTSQILLSGTSFLVSLLLIRYSSDTDYGLFILAQSAILLAITAQSSWMTGPLIGMAGQRQPEPRRAQAAGLGRPGRDLEAAAPLLVEQRAEDRLRVEARQPAPHHRAVPVDQRGVLAVAQEPEVVEAHCRPPCRIDGDRHLRGT